MKKWEKLVHLTCLITGVNNFIPLFKALENSLSTGSDPPLSDKANLKLIPLIVILQGAGRNRTIFTK